VVKDFYNLISSILSENAASDKYRRELEQAREVGQSIVKSTYENISRILENDHPFMMPLNVNGFARSVNREFDTAPLSVKGSEVAHSRFHHLSHGTKCLFFASSSATALAEKLQYPEAEFLKGLNKRIHSPKSIFCIEGELSYLLDFRNEEVVQTFEELGLIYKLIYDPTWETICAKLGTVPIYSQVLGKVSYDCGYEGILYNSTKVPGYNVVIFPDNMQVNSHIQLVGNENDLHDISIEDREIKGKMPSDYSSLFQYSK
jgi:hypothetical protein